MVPDRSRDDWIVGSVRLQSTSVVSGFSRTRNIAPAFQARIAAGRRLTSRAVDRQTGKPSRLATPTWPLSLDPLRVSRRRACPQTQTAQAVSSRTARRLGESRRRLLAVVPDGDLFDLAQVEVLPRDRNGQRLLRPKNDNALRPEVGAQCLNIPQTSRSSLLTSSARPNINLVTERSSHRSYVTHSNWRPGRFEATQPSDDTAPSRSRRNRQRTSWTSAGLQDPWSSPTTHRPVKSKQHARAANARMTSLRQGFGGPP